MQTCSLAIWQHERAIEDYDKAIELNPEYAAAYYNRGNRYRDLGQHERAIEDYDSAIELGPELAEAYSNRGITYADLGQHEQAIENYDMILELDSEYESAYYNKACSFALQNEVMKAVKLLRIAFAMDAGRNCRLAEDDSDFDSIREEKEFVELIKEFCNGD